MFGRAHLHRVIVGLLRRTWLVALVTAIVCAVISARAVAALLDAGALAAMPAKGLFRKAAVPPAPEHARPDGRALVARNMFCSTCAPARDEPGAAADYVPDAVLIATAIGTAQPGLACATLRVLGSQAQGTWELGETIPGLGRIDRIERASIDIVDTSGRRGRLSLLGAATPTSDAPAHAPAAAPDRPPWADRITRIDDHTYEVDRDLVRELVGSGAKAASGVRILPALDAKGGMTGLRLAGVAAASLPAAFGLRSGDVLTTINGTAITSANVLLDVYAHVDHINLLELDGTRGDAPLQLTLRMK